MDTIGIYRRVSTDQQTTANQVPDIERIIAAREPEGVARIVFEENVSAAKERPAFSDMMEAARVGRFRRLYIWSIDRFGRSMFQNLRDVITLVDRYRVELVSVKEPWLDMGDPMIRKLLLGIFSWVAEHERDRLRQRTAAGLARAKREGKVLGRPRVEIAPAALARAIELRANVERWPWRAVARELRRLGLGEYAHGTLAAACQKRVPNLERGKPGFPGSKRPSGRTSTKGGL